MKPAVQLPKPSVASAFNVDSDDETEEMPPECKMRMKNIGNFCFANAHEYFVLIDEIFR